MSEEMINRSEVIISQESVPAVPKKRRKRRPAAGRVAQPAIEMPQEESSGPGSLFTVISNLALLIAIFTIIFAAHHAFQKNRSAKTAQTAEEALLPARTETVANKEITSPTTPPVTANVETEKTAQPETPAMAEPKKEVSPDAAESVKPKQEKRTARYSSDPYTNGGPLDLDRRTNEDIKQIERSFADGGKESGNPWNSGGDMDLDSHKAREEYKKNYLSTNDSDN